MSELNNTLTEITENIIDTIENPVLAPLYPKIKCGAFTNKKGEILIAHDVPLPSAILWVEYDVPDDSFTLVHREGRIQDLGIKMTDKMRQNLKHGKLVQIAHLIDKKVKSAQKVTLVMRNY